KGYQITQDRRPVCVGGSVPVRLKNGTKNIRIHHTHMEEDAGKSIHHLDPKHSLVDLNRAGVPLLEIVSEPDLRSAEEVDAFMSAVRRLVRYLEISDGNMEEGSMRCDCNISVRLKGAEKLGQRCEVKNLNSMRFARQAIAYEVKRQIDLIESGGKVEQQTLNYDPQTGVTTPLRDKEEAHDYRYFPEPDLPLVIITEKHIEELKAQMPLLPWQLFQKFTEEYDLTAYEAELLINEKSIALFYLQLLSQTPYNKAAANLIINKIIPVLNEKKWAIEGFPISIRQLAAFIELIESGKVSHTIAYQRLFPALMKEPEQTPLSLAQSLNLLQTADAGFLDSLIDEVLSKNSDKVVAYKKGKKGLIGFFMGEVMKKSKGKADPKAAKKLLLNKLEV
ncbi:MAG: Asp-tRNA(Asn)/Glu-tRNA(Gln) amidotransferase subunit GatB, partial [Bacteroidetes bacterium]|nr:Asp-tRNA(Asn)/Glu-tRNA(Gln) amidotransferase subunit GatB [Bacteroidota bacterium]